MTKHNRWSPISMAVKDRNEYLLWFPAETLPPTFTVHDGIAINGWWYNHSDPNTRGWETPIGFIGEPTHFQYIGAMPDADNNS